MRWLILIFFLFEALVAKGQERRLLPMTAGVFQYAGSTGFLTAGIFKGNRSETVQLGMLYGYTPKVFGGELHSFSLKFIYNPLLVNLGKDVYSEPLQIGTFLSQSFGGHLYTKWPSKYPEGYYWWWPSLRGHVFLSTSLGLKVRNSRYLEKVSCYFEVNTNDLYLASIMIKNNQRSLTLYDIMFFGSGLKFYIN
jgi:hypothetical protein